MKTNSILRAVAASVLVAASASTLQARELAYDNDPDFSDLTLINCGDLDKRAAWTQEDFLPYLTHTYADGHEDWFFDAFLFVDTQRGNRKFGNDIPGVPASQADWRWMLDQFFDPELKLHALDALIEQKKAELGEPPLKHRVVLSLCLPCVASNGEWQATAWGMLDGQIVTLLTLDNRKRAMKWYLDEMVSRWQAENYSNLELVGVYWIEEGIYTNTDLVTWVNEYVHEKGLRSYWIPYYIANASSWTKAHAYKFDMTYLQPNYAFDYGDGSLPISVLKECCDNAKMYQLGLELEFETLGASSALHEVSPELHQRINDYMDAFEQYGVVDGGGIAYYTGSQGLIDMANSTDPVNQATMDRMAAMVARRQAAKKAAGVGAPFVDHCAIAYGGSGCLFVAEEGACCYDLSGRLVRAGYGRVDCPAGIYIVRAADGRSQKLIVH